MSKLNLGIFQEYIQSFDIPLQNSENSNVNTFDDITDDVSYIISQYSTGDGILLIGDFNARTGCMNDTYENDIYTDDYLDCTHEIDYNLPIPR